MDEDLDMTDGDKESEGEIGAEQEEAEKEKEWAVVEHHRDTSLAVKVAFDDLKGSKTKEKMQDLMEILKGTRVNPPRKPSKMRIDGMDYFRVQVSNQTELQALLGGVVESPTDTDVNDDTSEIIDDEDQETDFGHSERVVSTKHLFERIDQVAERKFDMARSIELYGLPARVNMELLRLAANQLGDVENIKLRACVRGVKMIATIHYEDSTCVEEMRQYGVRHFEVGGSLVRIRRLGEEIIKWELQFVSKLHGLPRGTTPVVLMAALGKLQMNVDFVEVPMFYMNGRQALYRQEAYVYFKCAEDMAKAMDTLIKMGTSEMVWLHTKDKRCYTCNGEMHGKERCPVLNKHIEDREHKKRVMNFHTKATGGVRKGMTYADLVKGKGNNNQGQKKREHGEGKDRGGQENAKQETVTMEEKIHDGLAAQWKEPQSKQTDYKKTIAEMMAKQKASEATIGDMQQAMAMMAENQKQLMEKIQFLVTEIPNMIKKAIGNTNTVTEGTQEEGEMMSSQESEVLIDNRKKKRKGPGIQEANAKHAGILSANESRANIEEIITEHKRGVGSNKNTMSSAHGINTRGSNATRS
jgi:hypothetical protein